MWQQRQRQLSIRRSLRWKFDGCERGTAVDSVGSSGEMARRFYVDEELLYVFKTADAKQFHVKVAPGLVGLVGEGQLAVQQKA